MPIENLKERTVEVLSLREDVNEELLYLYFENKRRSGGGPLVSVEKKGDRAVLVFEDAEAAAQVLSKGHHVLHKVELIVRRPAAKDECRLLMRGINPNTSSEMIELFVENMIGLNANEYRLYNLSGGDVLVHLNQPLSQDFQTLCGKVSSKTLETARVTLEQIEQTCSVLVENLHPGTTQDLLMLYFESKRGGNQRVRDVTMLSEGTAKVSFVNYESVGPILDQQHKLDGTELLVKPYFDFLQPTETTSQSSASGSHDLDDVQMQTNSDNRSSSQTTSERLAAGLEDTAEEAMDVVKQFSHIAMADPVKLALFQLSPLSKDIARAHPDFTMEVKEDGVLIEGSDVQKLEWIKQTIMEFIGTLVETHFTLEPEKAQFLEKQEVKDRLLQTIIKTPSPTLYSVSDCEVVVTSLSQTSAQQAFTFLTSQMCHFSIPLDKERESMLYCREWSEFLQTLDFSSVRMSERGGNIDVLTLKGMENEKQTAILQFLSTPIERDTLITMEPGALKYIQNYCHQLLADMDQVSIFPVEAEDVCGLKIIGPAVTCQMAEEVLRSVLSSICTKTITISAPGVARFLHVEECKNLLGEMESKFEVHISLQFTPWVPLPCQDIFEAAWQMMSHRNFQRVSADDPAQELPADPMQTDQNGTFDQDLLEEATKIVSAIDEKFEESLHNVDQVEDMDNEDLYTAEVPVGPQDHNSNVMALNASQSSAGGNSVSELASDNRNLKEEAQLSLAIQYSMESSQRSMEDEENQLQKALELSRTMMNHEASSSAADKSPQSRVQQKDINASLQETIKAANSIQLAVFAGYLSDLSRVEIAFGKRVSHKQVEEKLEHRSVKKMSEYHMKCLEMIQRKHAVDIQVKGTIITVSGFKHFQPAAVSDVKLLLEKVENSLSRQEVLRSVQWVVHDPASSHTTPYSPDAIEFIENAWRSKLKKLDILLDNEPHIINFEKMLECNVASQKTVKISRNIPDLELDEIPEEEYALVSNMPEITKVSEDSDEFQNVVKNFYDTIQEHHSKIRIIEVQKLMNRLLYNQFKLKKASIMKSATHPEVERTLYHGTNEKSMKEICLHGFNRSFCGKNATSYGQGVYFAVNSALSVQDQYSPPNADGHKFVLVSKVLTGDFTKGSSTMRTTPLKEKDSIPLRYDSVTDNITKPTMFVIFNDTQAFPEYLITCQRISH